MKIELVSLDEINQEYFFYDDLKHRRIKKWLSQYNIRIIKLGKKCFVKRDDFNEVLNNLINGNKPKKQVIRCDLPSDEQKAYKDLINKLR